MKSLVLAIHIFAGVTGLPSGAAAMWFRKGSQRHALAGNVFFVAMVVMGLSATYLGNVFGGLFACYLVTTAWVTAKRRNGETNIFDWAALLFALTFGVFFLAKGIGVEGSGSSLLNGVPVGMSFFLGCVAVFAAAGDIRMLTRGVFGGKRVVRHLWRMCFSFFIATGSFFLGQQKVFPKAWRGAIFWFVPALLPLMLLIFWVLRARFTNALKGISVSGSSSGNTQALPT